MSLYLESIDFDEKVLAITKIKIDGQKQWFIWMISLKLEYYLLITNFALL